MWTLTRVALSSPLLVSRPLRASRTRHIFRSSRKSSTPTAASDTSEMSTDWESMWRGDGKTLQPGQAFDANKCEPSLEALIEQGVLPTGRALVPGCGRGYAVEALASEDRDVLGLEVSETAKSAADSFLDKSPKRKHTSVVIDDFFTHTPATQYDLVFDSTFLCAIPPARREEWAAKYAEIIKPGGEIVSNVFPIGPFEGGPPFALSPDIVKSLLEPVGFEVVSLTETPETQWARGRPEFLYRFRRK